MVQKKVWRCHLLMNYLNHIDILRIFNYKLLWFDIKTKDVELRLTFFFFYFLEKIKIYIKLKILY